MPDTPKRGSLPELTETASIWLLVGATALVYLNTFRNEFTMDDAVYVVQNPQVTSPSLRSLFAPHLISRVFRPVTFATYALNWAIQGANPFGFHLINILLHAAVTVLLYFFLKSVLAALPHSKTVALVAAWLFALHPIHTEAVTSIAGRPELLAAAFLLAACILHIRDQEIPALACFLLALLSKESAVAFLPLVLVCDYVRGQWKPAARYLRLAGITLLYVGALWKLDGGRFGHDTTVLDNPLAGLPPTWRILNALRVAWKYVALQLYPRVLSCDYSFNQIPVYLDLRHTLPAALAAAVALALWIWAARRRQRGLVLAGGIYAAGFAATANILLPIGTVMGERLAYLPSAGICLLIALGWVWLFVSGEQTEKRRTALLALLVAILAAFGLRTVARNGDWKDNETLYSAGLRASPGSARMHLYNANVFIDADKLDLAIPELQTALKIYPNYIDALEEYGIVEFKLGDYQSAGAMLEKAFGATEKHNINYDFRAVNLAGLYMQTNHLDGALDVLNQDIAQSPGYARAWANRAVVYYLRGDPAAARSNAQTALRLDPGNLQAINLMHRLVPAFHAQANKAVRGG